jgi:hypothetical protein
VWKREVWAGGSEWATNAQQLIDAADVARTGREVR